MNKEENFEVNNIYSKAIINIDQLIVFLNEFINKHGKVKAVRNNFSGDKKVLMFIITIYIIVLQNYLEVFIHHLF
jgi:hypothetical protein